MPHSLRHTALLATGTALLALCATAPSARGQACDPVIFPETTVELPYTEGAVTYCLADGQHFGDYFVTLDGTFVGAGTDPDCGTYAEPGQNLYYDFTGVPGAGLGGQVYLHEWSPGGDLFGRQTFNDARDLANYMGRVNPTGGWRYDDANQRILSSTTTGDYSSLQIRWEATGEEFDLPVLPADAPGTSVTLPNPGQTYVVEVAARDNSCREQLTIVRRGPPSEPNPPSSTERFTVPQDADTRTLCVPTDEIPDATATTVCERAANGNVRIQGIGCFAYRPVTGFSGTDRACLLTCNDEGRCDTTFLEFTVGAGASDCGTFEVDGASRLTASDCGATATFRLRRTDDGSDAVSFTVDGAAATAGGGPVDFTLELPVGARRVVASAGGDACQQAFPVEVVCDDGVARPCAIPFDETLIGQGVVCGGPRREVFLPATPEELADFEIDVDGVRYLGPRVERVDARDGLPATVIGLPAEPRIQQTVTLSRGGDCAHTFQLATRCVTPAYDTAYAPVGRPIDYCVSNAELFLNLGEPIVADAGDESVVTLVAGGGGCVTATAERTGTSDAVVVACTRIGICDTTYVRFIAVPDDENFPVDRPTAMPDQTSVEPGQPTELDLLANDRLPSGNPTLSLLTDFRYGTAELGVDGRLAYTASGDICGVVDSATYELCAGVGCDTAVAAVRLRCEEVFAFGGISPNGDGINDAFVVEGLEDYPGSRLLIFNRWGNSVYEAVDYQNDWEGTFEELRLPDGTYFYLIELPGRPEPLAGYLEIYR